MTSEQLRKLQLCQLDLALEVNRICEENGLKCFLVDGSLIGAVRHSGFIPWDDDLDIGMYCDDYDRFIELCNEKLDNRFYLQNCKSDDEYGCYFSQLRIKNTVCVQKISQNALQDSGIFIDIHPFFDAPQNKVLLCLHCARFKFFKVALLMKSNYKIEKRNLISFVIRVFCKIVSREYIINKCDKIANSYKGKNTNIAVKIAGRHLDKDYILLENLTNMITKPFEGYHFSVMPDFNRMLTSVYGDYMQFPPIEEQGNRHEIVELDFGDYVLLSEEQDLLG